MTGFPKPLTGARDDRNGEPGGAGALARPHHTSSRWWGLRPARRRVGRRGPLPTAQLLVQSTLAASPVDSAAIIHIKGEAEATASSGDEGQDRPHRQGGTPPPLGI